MKYDVTAADLDKVINEIDFDNGQFHHSGKVRESFVINEAKRAIVVTDRVSAFDFILGKIPFKGQVLNQLAAWWFKQIDEINIPHHLLSVPHSNISLVRNVTPLPIEIVVRGYLTGTTTTSSWYAYNNHDRMISGLEMPEGMVKNQIFESPMVTPTTKPEVGHDLNISRAEIINQGLVSEDVYNLAESYALKMFALGQILAKERGLILVDTKYEMGLTSDGELLVIDEVHTPDSSRYWVADSYDDRLAASEEPEGLDKEFVRRMIVDTGYDVSDIDQNPADFMTDSIRLDASLKYLELYTRMTGDVLPLEKGDLKISIEETLRSL